MTTPEQQARDMLERMGIRNTHQRESAGELVELANLIAERDALKSELQALRGSAEPVAWLKEWDRQLISTSNGRQFHVPAGRCVGLSAGCHNREGAVERITPLYTRSAVPLTDALASDLAREMVKGGKSVEWLVRAIESHIKGAKP